MKRSALLVAILVLATAGHAEAQFASFGHAFQRAVSATGNGTAAVVAGYSTATFHVTTAAGPPVYNIEFEGSIDASAFGPLLCQEASHALARQTATSATGMWRCDVTGLTVFRTRVRTISGTGTLSVLGRVMAFPAGSTRAARRAPPGPHPRRWRRSPESSPS